MKITTTIFILFISLCSKGQLNPYESIKPDSVLIYDFMYKEDFEFGSILYRGKLSEEIKKTQKLDTITANKFNHLLGLNGSFGHGHASCFFPHLGVVYWKNGKVKAYINICMGCNVLEPNIHLTSQDQGKQGEGKKSYYILDGMSPSFRLYINYLLQKYNFSHQAKESIVKLELPNCCNIEDLIHAVNKQINDSMQPW